MKLVLIRHGATDWNVERRMQGGTDISVNEMGRQQVEKLRPFLQHVAPGYVVTSALKRTKETAAAAELKVDLHDKRLNEYGLGPWEGQLVASLDPDEYNRWTMGEFSPEGAEFMDVFFHRINRAIFEALAHARENDIETVCVVAHGGVIRRYLAGSVGLDLGKIVSPRHAGASVLDITEGHMTLEMYNYAGY